MVSYPYGRVACSNRGKYLTVELVQAHVTRGGVCLSGLIVHHFWCARLVAICEHVGVMDLR